MLPGAVRAPLYDLLADPLDGSLLAIKCLDHVADSEGFDRDIAVRRANARAAQEAPARFRGIPGRKVERTRASCRDSGGDQHCGSYQASA
jgi:hypothetical protein